MIPTLIVAGLVLGRWWRSTLVAAAIVWPLVLVASGVMDLEWGLLGAAGLAVINTLFGVLIHQAIASAVKRLRREDPVPRTD